MRLGKICGTQVSLHNLFLALLVVYSFFGLLPKVLLVFATVLVHELAHAVVARSYGLRVEELELLPFGGVARISDLYEAEPGVEAKVAFAGPLLNFLLAGGSWFFLQNNLGDQEMVCFFMRCNLMVAIFNLLPGLPLDGGRIYRTCLVRRLGFRRATERAANLGRLIAVFCGLGSFVSLYFGSLNLTMVIMAIFLFVAANKEKGMAVFLFMRYLTRKKEELSQRGVLPTEQMVATDNTPLKEVCRYFLPKKYQIVVVLDKEGKIEGMITESEVMEGLLKYGFEAPLYKLVKKQD